MKIKPYDRTNFNGYSNVVAGHFNNGFERLSYISAKLNDIGEHDLEKLTNLRREFPFLIKHKNNDIVTIVSYESLHRPRPSISIDGYRIFNSDELEAGIENDFLEIKAEKYSAKLFTFIAHLTKRLKYDKNLAHDLPIQNVLYECLDYLTTHISSGKREDAIKLFTNSFSGNTNGHNIANVMNKDIDRAFGDYFA